MKQLRSGRATSRASMLVAILALVAATGGLGYAAGQIGTSQIKNNAVTSAKIKNSNVKSPDIKNSGVTVTDLHPAARQASFVRRLGPVASVIYNADGVAPVMDMTFRTATAGLVDVSGLALQAGGPGLAPDQIIGVLDYNGDLGTVLGGGGTPAQQNELYSKLAFVVSNSGGGAIPFTLRVGAGVHTVKMFATNSTAVGGETVNLGLRNIAVQFTGGVTGTYQNFVIARGAVRGLLHP